MGRSYSYHRAAVAHTGATFIIRPKKIIPQVREIGTDGIGSISCRCFICPKVQQAIVRHLHNLCKRSKNKSENQNRNLLFHTSVSFQDNARCDVVIPAQAFLSYAPDFSSSSATINIPLIRPASTSVENKGFLPENTTLSIGRDCRYNQFFYIDHAPSHINTGKIQDGRFFERLSGKPGRVCR
jgi:hypothetical protein